MASPLIQLDHIERLTKKIYEELKDLKERLETIEGIQGIDCGEIKNNDN